MNTLKKKIFALLILILFGSVGYFAQGYLETSEYELSKNQTDANDISKKIHKASWWKPTAGLTFHIQHINSKEQAEALPNVDVINLELSHVQKYLGPHFFKDSNKKLVCYFSASYEPWRSDADLYPKNAIGGDMREWDEAWGNINKQSLRTFLEKRMDLAQLLGCDAIEIDNTDPAFNVEEAGFILTKEQNKIALIDLASQAHKRKMAIFLKNTNNLAKELEPYFDGVFNEQCTQYNECSDYNAFVKAGKPVFQVEYSICQAVKGHVVHKKDDYFGSIYTVCN